MEMDKSEGYLITKNVSNDVFKNKYFQVSWRYNWSKPDQNNNSNATI